MTKFSITTMILLIWVCIWMVLSFSCATTTTSPLSGKLLCPTIQEPLLHSLNWDWGPFPATHPTLTPSEQISSLAHPRFSSSASDVPVLKIIKSASNNKITAQAVWLRGGTPNKGTPWLLYPLNPNMGSLESSAPPVSLGCPGPLGGPQVPRPFVMQRAGRSWPLTLGSGSASCPSRATPAAHTAPAYWATGTECILWHLWHGFDVWPVSSAPTRKKIYSAVQNQKGKNAKWYWLIQYKLYYLEASLSCRTPC